MTNLFLTLLFSVFGGGGEYCPEPSYYEPAVECKVEPPLVPRDPETINPGAY